MLALGRPVPHRTFEPPLPSGCCQFRNEELHRLQEVASGTSYRVLTTVLTTAMHGEKFRCAKHAMA